MFLQLLSIKLNFRPGNSSENPPIRLPLTDRGETSPDMTSDDGIYSAILPYPSTEIGFYSVEILATSNEETKIAIRSAQLGFTFHHFLKNEAPSASDGTTGPGY